MGAVSGPAAERRKEGHADVDEIRRVEGGVVLELVRRRGERGLRAGIIRICLLRCRTEGNKGLDQTTEEQSHQGL